MRKNAEDIPIWKDVPGYGGTYQASTDGQVRKVFKNGRIKILSPFYHIARGSGRFTVALCQNGKRRETTVARIIAETFLGPCPDGYVAYHVNGVQSDNDVRNIRYIRKTDLGAKIGASANRRPVAKIDRDGTPVEFYSSARAAGRANYLSFQAVLNRCNGKAKNPFCMDGHDYQWDDAGCPQRKRK